MWWPFKRRAPDPSGSPPPLPVFPAAGTVDLPVSPGDEARGIRLSYNERIKVVELLAQYRSPAYVTHYVHTVFGKRVHRSTIEGYLETAKWRPLLERYRQEYLARLGDIPLAHQRVRMERLEGLYQEADQDPSLRRYPVVRRRELHGYLRTAGTEMTDRKGGDTITNIQTNIAVLDTAALERRRKELLQQIKTLEVTDAVSET